MTLRKKILIFVAVAYLAFIGITYALTNTLLLQHINNVEKQDITNGMERVRDLVSYNVALINDTCADWAQWDDTYAFANDADEAYIKTNFIDGTFETLRMNFMLVLNSSGALVYGKGYDLALKHEDAVPAGLAPYLKEDGLLKQGGIAGIVLLDKTPVLVAAQPILTSAGEGPSRGTLIMGRYMSSDEVASLAELSRISLDVRPYGDHELPDIFQAARAGISETKPVFVQPLDSSTIAGFITLEDISGQPALLIEGKIAREYYEPNRTFGNSLIIWFTLLGTAVGIVALIALNKWLLVPLSSLGRSIGRISLKGSLAGRVEVKGKDEIAGVAGKVNEMLGALEQGQKDLAESEGKYHDLFDNAHDMIQSTAPDGRILYANPAWRKTLGYTEKETGKLNLFDIIHPDSLEHCQAIFQQILAGEEIQHLEADFITRDGQRIHVIGSASCRFVDGKPVYTWGIFHNVTELKQAEELFRSLAIYSPVGIYIVQKGKFIYSNPRFQKDTGYSEGELLGMESLSLVVPEDRSTVRENAIQMVKGKRATPYEFRIISKNGDIKWAMEAVAPIQYQRQQASIVSYQDITEIKQMQAKLQELYESEKNLRHDLQEELGKRIEFTRVLAHELKNSLTSLMASSELIADELHDEPWHSLAKNIYRSTTHLHNRVKELLDMARMEMGTLKIQPSPMELGKMLLALAEDIKPLASSRGQAIVLDLPQSLPSVSADGDRLWQVVLNLLDNASKFTPSGGTITISAEVQPPFLVISVRDTGKGISENEISRLFNFYHRVESDRDHIPGLGLGLALCKTIVEAHGGKIWANSKKGEGSTFYFSIPLASSEPDQRKKP